MKITCQPAPRLWTDATCVCIASGPSLTAADVEAVRGRAHVIAVNTSYQLAPWADALWATDARWWVLHKGAPTFQGLRFGLAIHTAGFPKGAGIHLLRNDGTTGLCLDPTGVRNGRNGGYCAINLAVHLGATRVLLLGYDCAPDRGRHHWHRDHPWPMLSPYFTWRKHFATLVAPLASAGVTVINCSRTTALEAFPRQPLETALAGVDGAEEVA